MKRKNGNGSICARPDGKWRARAWIEGRRRDIGVFASEPEAQRFLSAWTMEVSAGNIIAPKAQTLGNFGELWLDRREINGSRKRATIRDIDNERSLWRTHVEKSRLAGMALDAIRVRDVDEFVATLRRKKAMQARRQGDSFVLLTTDRPLSRVVVKHALRLVRCCMDDARRQEIITVNPAVDADVGHATSTDEVWDFLRTDEIDALLRCDEFTEEARTFYAVAIFAGLRVSEIIHLRWADVQLDVEVPGPSITVRFGKHGGATKSGKMRKVPVLPALLPWLRGQRERTGRLPYVFMSPHGAHFSAGYTAGWPEKKARESALSRAGVARRVRFHDLRHTCGTHLALGSWGRRWSPIEIKGMLGHSSLRVTERYTHLADSTLDEAARETRGGLLVPSPIVQMQVMQSQVMQSQVMQSPVMQNQVMQNQIVPSQVRRSQVVHSQAPHSQVRQSPVPHGQVGQNQVAPVVRQPTIASLPTPNLGPTEGAAEIEDSELAAPISPTIAAPYGERLLSSTLAHVGPSPNGPGSPNALFYIASPGGLEPPTVGLEGRYSIRLSYGDSVQTLPHAAAALNYRRTVRWGATRHRAEVSPRDAHRLLSGWRDSNPRPQAPKARALPGCATPRIGPTLAKAFRCAPFF